jgi:hypothetical protein
MKTSGCVARTFERFRTFITLDEQRQPALRVVEDAVGADVEAGVGRQADLVSLLAQNQERTLVLPIAWPDGPCASPVSGR